MVKTTEKEDVMLTVGELKKALEDVPDDSSVSLEIRLQSGTEVASTLASAVDVTGPDLLGFHWCTLAGEISLPILCTSDSLAEVAPDILHEVADTGKPFSG